MKSLYKSLALSAAFGLLVLSISTRGDASPATQPAPANITKLINQLGSDSNTDRDAAQQQLITLGEPAVTELKKAAETSDDPEIRSRSASILQSLKDHQINRPALITLHANQMSAHDVLDAIGSQAHVQITALGMAVSSTAKPGKTVTLDADQKPFWEVMSDVCKQLNVCPSLDYNGLDSMRLTPVWENWMARPAHEIVGRTWISVESLTHTRTVDLNGDAPARDQFTGRLIVFPEPGLHVTHLSDFTVEQAIDDAGHSLMPRALPVQISSSRASHPIHQLNHQLEFSLMYPDQQPGSKISILKGSLTMVVARDPQQYKVDDVLGTPIVTNPLNNAGIVTTFARQGSNYSVEIQCTRGSLDQDQWDAMINCMDDPSLLDTAGHRLIAVSPIGIHSMSNMPGMENFKASGLFSPTSSGKAGEPRSFQWNIPSSLQSEHLVVTFKDLPMP